MPICTRERISIMPGGGVCTMGSSIHLRSLLLTLISGLFAALLIGSTGDLEALWPLFGIPILAASLAFHVPGAIVTSAAVAAIALLLHVELGGSVQSLPSELVWGITVFVLMGLAVGLQAKSWEKRYHRLQAYSVTDQLTGLYTEDCLRSKVGDEIGRADRYGIDVSLLLIEVDGLKSFRETFGRHRGDLLLSHLAQLLGISVRSTDVPARHSDGFGLILPFASPERALATAERIRAIISEAQFEGDELQPITHQTLSIGIGSYPSTTRDLPGLYAQAHSGIESASQAGGDTVKAGEPSASERTPLSDGAPATGET